MKQDFPFFIFLLTGLLFFLELIFILVKKTKIADKFRIIATMACMSGLAYIIVVTKRLPLFGPFEASFYILFILTLLVKESQKKHSFPDLSAKLSLISSIVILFILALQAGKSMVINPDYYMYDNIWVMLFFNLRLIAAAFLIHAMVLSLTGFYGNSYDQDLLHRSAKKSLLIGTIIYLSSEWSGSIWCLNWFGESWRWNNGFFKSSMVFLLVMLACHLPTKVSRNRFLRTLFACFPGLFVLWIIFFH